MSAAAPAVGGWQAHAACHGHVDAFYPPPGPPAAEGVAAVTPAEADQAVARGAGVLDERGPAGWRETVALAIKRGQLNMDLGEFEGDCGCVLAWTHGDYWDALGELLPGAVKPGPRYDNPANAWAIAHGFCAEDGGDAADDEHLAAAWARLLDVEPARAEP